MFRPIPVTFAEFSLPGGPASGWTRIALPHTWDPRTGERGLYRLNVDVRPDRPGGRVQVRFGACATRAKVRLDGETLAEHVGDWVPFTVPIPDGYDGPGELIVEVTAPRDHPTRGFLPVCGLEHAGLWQGVMVWKTGPSCFVRDAFRVRATGDGRVHVVMPTHGERAVARRVVLGDVRSGDMLADCTGEADEVVLETAGLDPWGPWDPVLYELQVVTFDADGEISDAVGARIGVRAVEADGHRLLVNGVPVQLRGVLHWGYYPETGSPMPDDPARVACLFDWDGIRKELERYRIMGFNAVKCCLWIPPRAFLTMCDALGMMVWQEYPVWMTALDGAGLVDEYDAWFRGDALHPSVVLRTLTCENDAMSPDTVREVRARARTRLGESELLLDNSAWLQIGGEGDFHDEHPYLHNAQWDHYLERTRRALAERPSKPLMLGETCALDSLPSERDLARGGEPGTPTYLDAYRAVLNAWGGEPEGLRRRTLHVGDLVRRYQLERLRLKIPGAGYVLNSARDIPQCPIGFADSHGAQKTRIEGFAGQADSVVIADLPRRSFESGEELRVQAHVSHFGSDPLLVKDASWRLSRYSGGPLPDTTVAPGELAALGEITTRMPETSAPRRLSLDVAGARGSWPLWTVPDLELPASVHVTDTLDDARPLLAQGGAVVLLAHRPVAGGWRCPENVFWSFIPHLVDGLPAPEMIAELLPFDLLSGRGLAWDGAQGRPLIECLDLHSQEGHAVRLPLVLEGRVGEGRLLITALDHSKPGGRWLLATLALWLDREAFDAPAIELGAPARTLMLDGPWTMAGAGHEVVTGTPSVNEGRNTFEGWETFQGCCLVPESWRGERILLRAEAVGDAWRLVIDGERILVAGDEQGVLDGQRDVPRTFDLTRRLTPGKRHDVAFEVRDWRGAGGMVGPVYLTTTDPEGRPTY